MKFFLLQCIIFYNQYIMISAKALIGENVREMREEEFPFVVPLVIHSEHSSSKSKSRFCIGTIISNQKVLTAEHCLQNIEIHRIRIYIRSHDIKLGIKYNVFWILTFKDWAAFRNMATYFTFNDIAITKLSATIPDDIRPIALSTMSNSELYGLDVSIVGWAQPNHGKIPSTMETSFIKVLTYRECEERVKRLRNSGITVHEGMLCTATRPFTYLTSGDSGGPVLYNNTIVGLNSGTCLISQSSYPDKINIHFSIDYYRYYILDVLQNF